VRDGEIVFEKATSRADSGDGAEPVGAGSARD
jgi:hypothetical protein